MNGTDVPDIPDVRVLQDRMARALHDDGRPCKEIVVSSLPQKEISMQALSAIELYNSPAFIFNRSGNRVWVIRDEEGNPRIDILKENEIRYILERSCQFYMLKKQKHEKEIHFVKEPIAPPKPTVQDLQGAPSWPLPPLEGVVECPYMLSDGTIVVEGGYHPQSKLFYMRNGLDNISIPEIITDQHIKEAKEIIDDVFVDFMFVDDASKTNNVAALLTAVLRPLIPGISPLLMYDKPIMGSGASLLSKIIMIAALGRVPTMIPAPDTDEEMEKRIMAVLFSGMKIVVFDNCEGKVYFKSLASALTSDIISQRLFGKNTIMVTAKNNVVWIINGNNVQLGGDLPRRCVPIRIDPKTSRPWQRNGFTHPDILAYVLSRRHMIVGAVLTLAKAWHQAGQPKPPADVPNLGSYEQWRDIVGGILYIAGYTRFLSNLENMYQESDVETPQWEAFLETWYAIWGSDRKRVRDVVERLEIEKNSSSKEYSGEHKFTDVMPDFILGEGRKKDPNRVIGRALLKIRDREWSNGLKVIRAGNEKNTAVWRVLKKDQNGGFVGFGGLAPLDLVQEKISGFHCSNGLESSHLTTLTPRPTPTTKSEALALLELVKGDQSKLTPEQQQAVRKSWGNTS